jgi:hypothetical protein
MRKVVVLALACAACAPEFTDDVTRVTSPRLLVAVAEPAEVRPRAPVTIVAMSAPDPANGYAREHPFRFTFCTTPATVGDPRPVSDACLDEPGVALTATADVGTGTVPQDACARYGPDPPPGDHRPRDPDATGGFYQPVRIDALGQKWVHLLRVTCALPDAPAALARELAETYVANANPVIEAVETERIGEPGADRVRVTVRWTPESRESYPRLSPDGSAIEQREEFFRASWFTTSGTFAPSATATEEGDGALEMTNELAVGADAAPMVWVVLRDSRGGASVASQRMESGE